MIKFYFAVIRFFLMIVFGLLVRQCDWLLGDRQGGIGDVNEGLDQSRYVNSVGFFFSFMLWHENILNDSSFW